MNRLLRRVSSTAAAGLITVGLSVAAVPQAQAASSCWSKYLGDGQTQTLCLKSATANGRFSVGSSYRSTNKLNSKITTTCSVTSAKSWSWSTNASGSAEVGATWGFLSAKVSGTYGRTTTKTATITVGVSQTATQKAKSTVLCEWGTYLYNYQIDEFSSICHGGSCTPSTYLKSIYGTAPSVPDMRISYV